MTAVAKDLMAKALGVAAPAIDVLRQSPLWSDEAEAIVVRAIRTAAAAIANASGEVAVVLTDDAAIRALNRDWRKLDKPTNVLSFPAPPRSAVPGTAIPSTSGAPALLGDIVIAYETTAREALAEGKPFSHHLAHLAVHGFLHLLGYDHESDAAAHDMERLEARILARLDVPDPYSMRETGS
jgi:probable rRNA maturation factor